MRSVYRTKPSRDVTNFSRRDFLKTVTAAGALSISPIVKSASPIEESAGLPINMAGYDYDRVHSLIDGRVGIKGCNIDFEISSIGEMNTHIFSGPQTREVTEIGLHPFMLAYLNDAFRDYTLLPIFPLSVFRHKSVFIRTDRGIKKPEDLRGKKIGVTGYSSTSLTWIRGIFQDEYGVTPDDVQWVFSSKDSAAKASGGPSKQENVLPEGLTISMGPEGQDESDLLESGEVDALFHAAEPRAYIQGNPIVARLFHDFRTTERAYFAKTGIFPIMHAVAIRKDVLEQNPWLAEAVFNAYSQAKQMTYDYLLKSAWYKASLPWVTQEMEETRTLMGKNFWPYGIKPNRDALNALFRYSYEQGFSSRELTIEELFHSSGMHLSESLG
jgi:4,5-dihydroxyphthalate decarboxylase